MKTFAQLDENGCCFAVSYLSDDAVGEGIVELTKLPAGFSCYEDYYLGRQRKKGRWLKNSVAEEAKEASNDVQEAPEADGEATQNDD